MAGWITRNAAAPMSRGRSNTTTYASSWAGAVSLRRRVTVLRQHDRDRAEACQRAVILCERLPGLQRPGCIPHRRLVRPRCGREAKPSRANTTHISSCSTPRGDVVLPLLHRLSLCVSSQHEEQDASVRPLLELLSGRPPRPKLKTLSKNSSPRAAWPPRGRSSYQPPDARCASVAGSTPG